MQTPAAADHPSTKVEGKKVEFEEMNLSLIVLPTASQLFSPCLMLFYFDGAKKLKDFYQIELIFLSDESFKLCC